MDAKQKAKDGHSYQPRAFLDLYMSKVVPRDFKVKPAVIENTDSPAPAPQGGGEDEVNAILVSNQQMNAATFLNLLKSKGFKFVKEADTASANVQALRAEDIAKNKKKKKDVKKESSDRSLQIKTSTKIIESSSPEDKTVGYTKFKCVLIQEGMGNFRDQFFYSKDALKSAVSIFEGKKIYADHPSAVDEETRPERSVRDILGHFENVNYVENEGRGTLEATLCIMPDDKFSWARNLVAHAIEYSKKFPDKDFIGLSINASGDAEEVPLDKVIEMGIPEAAALKINEAKEQGIETLRLVSKITDAVSCDLVTEAGAGGRILDFLEGDFKMGQENESKEKENKEGLPPKDEGKENPKDEGKDAGDKGHDDAEQDKKLIQDMIKKHLGNDANASEEECGLVKEAYEAHKEMGEKDEDAQKMACSHLKMAKHLASKKESKESKEGEKVEEKDQADIANDKDGNLSAGDEKAKLLTENATLRAENIKFKEAAKKAQLSQEIDKICKESKQSNEVTKEFKKLVESAKSIDEVKKVWTIFEAGLKNAQKETEGLDFSDLVTSTEKTSTLTESKKAGASDYSDILL